MFFTIKTNKSKAYFNARRTILLFPMSASEIVLDRYLIETYHSSLKQLCFQLLNNANFDTIDDETIITFKTKKEDNLASLITYGTGKLQGSKILTYAFGRD